MCSLPYARVSTRSQQPAARRTSAGARSSGLELNARRHRSSPSTSDSARLRPFRARGGGWRPCRARSVGPSRVAGSSEGLVVDLQIEPVNRHLSPPRPTTHRPPSGTLSPPWLVSDLANSQGVLGIRTQGPRPTKPPPTQPRREFSRRSASSRSGLLISSTAPW